MFDARILSVEAQIARSSIPPPSLTATTICRLFFNFKQQIISLILPAPPTRETAPWRAAAPKKQQRSPRSPHQTLRSDNLHRSACSDTDCRLMKTKRILIKHRITYSKCASFGEGGREGRQLFSVLEALG